MVIGIHGHVSHCMTYRGLYDDSITYTGSLTPIMHLQLIWIPSHTVSHDASPPQRLRNLGITTRGIHFDVKVPNSV